MNFNSQNDIVRWASGLAALMAAVLIIQYEPDLSPIAAGSGRTTTEANPSTDFVFAPRNADGQERTPERLLFGPRPQQPTAESTQTAAPGNPPDASDPTGWTLLGVLLDGDIRRALIGTDAKVSGEWVSEGETLSGWSLKRITSENVVLENANRSIDVPLYRRSSASQ